MTKNKNIPGHTFRITEVTARPHAVRMVVPD